MQNIDGITEVFASLSTHSNQAEMPKLTSSLDQSSRGRVGGCLAAQCPKGANVIDIQRNMSTP